MKRQVGLAMVKRSSSRKTASFKGINHSIKHQNYNSGEKFLSALCPWRWSNEWIFRGHADANWELIPAYWRIDDNAPLLVQKYRPKFLELAEKYQSYERLSVVQRYLDNLKWQIELRNQWNESAKVPLIHISDDVLSRNIQLLRGWLILERELIARFAKCLDDTGKGYYEVAPAPYSVMNPGSEKGSFFTSGNPTSSIDGIAQHQGVPTRLLDWSMNPFVAAFFAAHEDSDVGGEETDISVWAYKPGVSSIGIGKLMIFEPPKSHNSNLASQQGLFTYVLNANYDFLITGKWPKHTDCGGHFVKLSVQRREAKKILEFLERLNISYPAIYPVQFTIAKHLLRINLKDMLRTFNGAEPLKHLLTKKDWQSLS